MYQGRHGGDCDECKVYPRERSEGVIHTSHIATMSLEVHMTFCVQIGGKCLIVCERVVSRGQSSVGRYEHFAVEAGGMNILPDCVVEAQLAACRPTRKHAMRLFPPVWTQRMFKQ